MGKVPNCMYCIGLAVEGGVVRVSAWNWSEVLTESATESFVEELEDPLDMLEDQKDRRFRR